MLFTSWLIIAYKNAQNYSEYEGSKLRKVQQVNHIFLFSLIVIISGESRGVSSADKPAIIELMSDRAKEKIESRDRNEFWERVRSGKFFEDTDRVARGLKELNQIEFDEPEGSFSKSGHSSSN